MIFKAHDKVIRTSAPNLHRTRSQDFDFSPVGRVWKSDLRMKAEKTQMMQSENILKYVSESVKSTERIWTQNDLSEEMFIFLCAGIEVCLVLR